MSYKIENLKDRARQENSETQEPLETRKENEPDFFAEQKDKIISIGRQASEHLSNLTKAILDRAPETLGLTQEEVARIEQELGIKKLLNEKVDEITNLATSAVDRLQLAIEPAANRSGDKAEIQTPKSEVVEKYQGKRASLFSNVLIRRLASSGLDMVPLAGDISMALKGITGKDYITNEKLSGKQRLIYTSVGVIGTALFFVPGMNVASEGVRDLIVQGKAVNKGLLNGKSTAALKSLAQAGLTKGETYSSAATVLLKTAEFMEKHPSLVRAAESKVEDVLLANHPRNVKYRSQKLATV